MVKVLMVLPVVLVVVLLVGVNLADQEMLVQQLNHLVQVLKEL